MAKIFYKDAAVAILVYDITRKQSFEEIKNYWIGQLKDHAPKNLGNILYNSVIAIAANKSDMWENEEVDEKVGKDYAKDVNALFKSISAKTNSGIEDLFKAVGSKFVHPAFTDVPLGERVTGMNRQQSVKLGQDSNKKRQGGCC